MEHWRELYVAALLEFDPRKLRERIQAAEQAIIGNLEVTPKS